MDHFLKFVIHVYDDAERQFVYERVQYISGVRCFLEFYHS